MAIKYYSNEWLEELKKRSVIDEKYKKEAKDMTFRQQYLIMGYPGGVDLLSSWTMEKGVIVHADRIEKPAPSDFRDMPFDDKTYLFRAIAGYETFCKTNRKDITALQALLQKVYTIKGPLPRIMTVMRGMNALTDLMNSIPCEY